MSDQSDADFDQWLRSALQHWPHQVELRITPMNVPANVAEAHPSTFVITGEAVIQTTASEGSPGLHVVRWLKPTTMKVEDTAT